MKTHNLPFLFSASLVALWFTLAFPAAAAVWDGPKQYVLLSTSDAFEGSTRKGKAQPNPYQIVHDTYGSFEGKSVALGVSPMFRVFQKDMPVQTAEFVNASIRLDIGKQTDDNTWKTL